MAGSVYIFCGLLCFFGLVFLFTANWNSILSHVPMFIAGTAFFLFPGAILKREQLWYFQPQTETIAYSAILASLVCMGLGYAFGIGTKKFRSQRAVHPGAKPTPSRDNSGSRQQLPERCPPIPTRVVLLVFMVCFLIKTFLDYDTIVATHFLLIPVGREAGVWAKILLEISYVPTGAACLAPWLWRNARDRSASTRTLLLGLVAMGIFSTSRTPAFYVLGTLIFFWLWENHAKWATAGGRLVLVGTIALILPLVIFLAALVKGSNMLAEQVSGDDALNTSFSDVVDFAVNEQYKIAISDTYGNLLFAIDHYPQPYEYQPTLSIASIVTAIIPRAWVPSKGYTPSYVLTSQIMGAGTFESTGNSLATSFVGELWMNYGWIAVALGSFVLGLVGAAFRRLNSMHWDGSHRHILFLMSLVAFLVTPRGDVFSTTLRGCVYIAMAWAVARCVISLSRWAQLWQKPGMRRSGLAGPLHLKPTNNIPYAS